MLLVTCYEKVTVGQVNAFISEVSKYSENTTLGIYVTKNMSKNSLTLANSIPNIILTTLTEINNAMAIQKVAQNCAVDIC
ncbi:10632_t:CDS:2 [Dentiscutata erythropus]|uniref:10632_t:CDS:1 n=1 Tax=Dentiscutata erythropus TaxID=1348616 RepID=A0A9N8WAH4_9GLOM|nr:10632_t:CDS:2 [Dentiscutata erythropus]